MATNAVFTGAAAGAATGSAFGSGGALVGGIVGGMMGQSANKDARRERRRQTRQAYSLAEQSFSYQAEGRQNSEDAYEKDLAQTRARFVGSGGELHGASWENAKARHKRQYDEQMSMYDEERAAWRTSDAYSLFEDDYDHMVKQRWDDQKPGKHPDQTDGGVHTITGEGRTGENLFMPGQKNKLMTLHSSNQGVNASMYKDYLKRALPSLQEYEKYRFGSDEDKSAYAAAIDERVGAANVWLKGRIAAFKLHTDRSKPTNDDRNPKPPTNPWKTKDHQ